MYLGTPGVGKTTIAEEVANSTGMRGLFRQTYLAFGISVHIVTFYDSGETLQYYQF